MPFTARLSAFGASRWAFLTSNVDRYFARETAETFAKRHSLAYRVFADEADAIDLVTARRADSPVGFAAKPARVRASRKS